MSGRLYLTALTSLERLEIQYVPKDLAITRSPLIAGVAIVGRNNPKHHYLGGNTDLNLELDFHSEEANREDVIRKCKWLEALAYGDGDESPPENVKITFGKLFRSNEVWVVKNVQYRLSLFEEKSGFLPKQAYVQMTLSLDTKKNLKLEDVKWN